MLKEYEKIEKLIANIKKATPEYKKEMANIKESYSTEKKKTTDACSRFEKYVEQVKSLCDQFEKAINPVIGKYYSEDGVLETADNGSKKVSTDVTKRYYGKKL